MSRSDSRSGSRPGSRSGALPDAPAGPKSLTPLNPSRLDVAALADRAEVLEGTTPLSQFSRLSEPGEPSPAADAALGWSAHAQRMPVRGAAPELWLHLKAHAVVERTCQRCLQAVGLPLTLERAFLFAPDEEQAEAWDAEREDADVLVLTKSLDLMELVEDELLLALPIVPRHEECPQPLVAPEAGVAGESSPNEVKGDNPFAILAQLKRHH